MAGKALCGYSHSKAGGARVECAPGSNLCRGCLSGLYLDIRRAVVLYHELEAEATSVGGVGGGDGGRGVSGTKDRGLKYNRAALEVMDQIRLDLWMNVRGLIGGGDADLLRRALTTQGMGVFLSGRVRELGRSADAGAIRRTFRELVLRGEKVLAGPVRRRVGMGECPVEGCEGELVAVVSGPASTVECESCGTSLPPAKWGRFGKKHGYC